MNGLGTTTLQKYTSIELSSFGKQEVTVEQQPPDLGFKSVVGNNEIKETIEQKIGEAAKSLLVAIQTDDLDKVKSIVQKLDELGAAHIYTRESFILSGGKNLTALEYAAKRNHEQIVEFLLPKVIVHKKPTYDNMHSAFHLANDKIQDIIIEAITLHQYAIKIYEISNKKDCNVFVTLQDAKDYLDTIAVRITTSQEAKEYYPKLSDAQQIIHSKNEIIFFE